MTRLLALILLFPLAAHAESPPQERDGANFDLILHGEREVHINRPLTIRIVHDLPHGRFAQAENAFNDGECVIDLDENNLRWLFHEIQHCAGEHH